jgi:hypothetical protein
LIHKPIIDINIGSSHGSFSARNLGQLQDGVEVKAFWCINNHLAMLFLKDQRGFAARWDGNETTQLRMLYPSIILGTVRFSNRKESRRKFV